MQDALFFYVPVVLWAGWLLWPLLKNAIYWPLWRRLHGYSMPWKS